MGILLGREVFVDVTGKWIFVLHEMAKNYMDLWSLGVHTLEAKSFYCTQLIATDQSESGWNMDYLFARQNTRQRIDWAIAPSLDMVYVCVCSTKRQYHSGLIAFRNFFHFLLCSADITKTWKHGPEQNILSVAPLPSPPVTTREKKSSVERLIKFFAVVIEPGTHTHTHDVKTSLRRLKYPELCLCICM